MPRFVRSKGKVIFGTSGRPASISGTLQDITGQKQREQYKDDFINVASHELKTPVTSLKASMQILNRMKDNPVPTVFSKMITQSNKSLDMLTRLIKVLLDSNRVVTISIWAMLVNQNPKLTIK
ncbi:MAG: hypothetical protein EOP45_06545 [Sphingobacteriaceae bacterium]|nr:MAG: hypothetical protein EOP45_06545 [Sphingobacteriaceae bacterium]